MKQSFMSISCHRIPLLICSFFLLMHLLLLPFHLSAAAPELDPQLEQQLEQYLQLTARDPAKSELFLLSLQAQVTPLTPIASKVRYLIYLSAMYATRQDLAKADENLKQSWQLAEQANHTDIWAEVSAEHLSQYWGRGNHAKAVEYLELTLKYAPNASQPRVRYYAFNTAGRFQAWQGKYEAALSSYYAADESLNQDENPRTLYRKMFLKAGIANIHSSLRNHPLALKTIREALDTAELNADLHSYLPEFYMQEGFTLVELNQLDDAIAANEKGLTWARQLNNGVIEATLLNNQGDIFMRQNKLPQARAYFSQCLAFALKTKDKITEQLARFNLGYVQVREGDYPGGIQQMQAMVELEKVSGAKSDLLGLLQELADAHRLGGNHQAEATILRDYNQLSQELFQADREKQLNQLQEEYSAKEKTKEIEVLTQQNRLKAIEIERQNLQQEVTLLIGVVVLLASGLLFLLYRKVQTANQQLKEVNDQLAYQSLRDPLTGLFNRRSFQEHMEKRGEQGERRQPVVQPTDGFILLDVDFFKHVNDHFGHAAGDAVLVEIAKRLTKLTRNDDMVLRWGGEEFLILLRRVDMAALTQFTQRVLEVIGATPVTFGQQHIRVTASAGFLIYPFAQLDEQSLNWTKALQLADMALYLGKVHGRNRAYGLLKLNRPYQDIAAQLETDLSQAIEQGKVDVVLVAGPAKEQQP